MSQLKTDLYVTGAVMTIRWRNDEEHALGKVFLRKLAGAPSIESGADARECYYLHDKDKFEALLDFRKALRKKRSSKG